MALVMAQINIVDIALVMALMYMAQVDMALVMALMYMAQVDMALVMTQMYMAQEDMARVMAPLVMTLTMEDINVISWDLTNSLKMIERKSIMVDMVLVLMVDMVPVDMGDMALVATVVVERASTLVVITLLDTAPVDTEVIMMIPLTNY